VVALAGSWDHKGDRVAPEASHMLEEIVAEVLVAVDERMDPCWLLEQMLLRLFRLPERIQRVKPPAGGLKGVVGVLPVVLCHAVDLGKSCISSDPDGTSNS